MTRTITHWVNGTQYEGSNDRRSPVHDPATGQVRAEVLLASPEDCAVAIADAARASTAWAQTSLARRSRVVFKFRELLDQRRGELAAIITSEHGKVLSDAAGEVARGQEVVELACGIAHLLRGGHSHAVSTGIDVHSVREPVGVVGIISPFNFPAMVPMWFFPIAIAAGNAVILKPSEKDPSASIWLASLWKEAGLPDGVFTVLQGDKVAVDALLEHPDVAAISFVGSTPVAKYVYERGTARGKRVQALGGAKNHMVVLPDADLDHAADSAISAAFGSAGERCMAISVVVAVGAVADELVSRVVDRARLLVVGDGADLDQEPDFGPLVSRAHADRVLSLIDAGERDGATVLLDGRSIDPQGHQDGFWVGPTVFDHVRTDMEIYTEEIFGPVLAIVRVRDLEEAITLINNNPYGNGTALFTRDGGAARHFESSVQVGMIGVNVPVPVPVAYYSFGGWKASLFGDTHAHGSDGVHFYTRTKVVTSRWPLPAEDLRSASHLGFPQND